jgi:hypothetical protein
MLGIFVYKSTRRKYTGDFAESLMAKKSWNSHSTNAEARVGKMDKSQT